MRPLLSLWPWGLMYGPITFFAGHDPEGRLVWEVTAWDGESNSADKSRASRAVLSLSLRGLLK